MNRTHAFQVDYQWRIQNFFDGGANPKGGANLLFSQFSPLSVHENEEIYPERGRRVPAPPPRSTNGYVLLNCVQSDWY